jgi:hypothetical protein
MECEPNSFWHNPQAENIRVIAKNILAPGYRPPWNQPQGSSICCSR